MAVLYISLEIDIFQAKAVRFTRNIKDVDADKNRNKN